MIDRLTAEQVGELEGPASRLARGVGDMNDMEKMVRHLPSLLATAKREAVQDRIIAGEGADSDSALACLMYVAMAGKGGFDRIAPEHVEKMLARVTKYKKRAETAESRVAEKAAEIERLRGALDFVFRRHRNPDIACRCEVCDTIRVAMFGPVPAGQTLHGFLNSLPNLDPEERT